SATLNYNVWASTEANLSWFFKKWIGARGGASFEKEDPSTNKVTWDAPPNSCTPAVSLQSGLWSSTSTWDTGIVPTSCTVVSIGAGTTVTLDISNATASTTTINGTLSASRVAGSTLTLVAGNLTVNSGGTLDLGTSASP